MIFYAGTWTFPQFYHVTEVYNTSIVFAALVLLFFNNIHWIKALRTGDKMLWVMGVTLAVSLLNLFIIGSNKGCFLIIADFLLIWYLAPHIRFTDMQKKVSAVFFLLMFVSWFVYDRAFSYNSNTGATVTVFTFFGAMVLLSKITSKKEIYGFFTVISVIRVVTLVLWHLARGAFLALFLFLFFFYVGMKFFVKKKWAFNALVLFSTIGSLLFVASYVVLGNTGFNMQLPFFYKNIFSGREQIWFEVWDILKGQILFGIGSGRHLKSFFEYNIHNAMYDILAVYGLTVFIGSMILLWTRLREIRDALQNASTEKLCAASALFAIFIESFIDMDLMWADYSPLLLFLLCVIFAGHSVKGNGEA